MIDKWQLDLMKKATQPFLFSVIRQIKSQFQVSTTRKEKCALPDFRGPFPTFFFNPYIIIPKLNFFHINKYLN